MKTAFAAVIALSVTAQAADPIRLPGDDVTPTTAAERAVIKGAVGALLIDPDNALYRWPKRDRGSPFYCGFVNGKNRLGGYTGYQPFVVTLGSTPLRATGASVASSLEPMESGRIESVCATSGYDLSTMPPELPATTRR